MPIFNNPNSFSLYEDPMEQLLNPSPIPNYGVSPTSLSLSNNYQSNLDNLFQNKVRQEEADKLDRKRSRRQGLLQALPFLTQILTAKDQTQISRAIQQYSSVIEQEKNRVQQTKSQQASFAQQEKIATRNENFSREERKASKQDRIDFFDIQNEREDANFERDTEAKKDYARYTSGLEEARLRLSNSLQTDRSVELMKIEKRDREELAARAMADEMATLGIPVDINILRTAAAKYYAGETDNLSETEKFALATYGNDQAAQTNLERMKGRINIGLALSQVKVQDPSNPYGPPVSVNNPTEGGRIVTGDPNFDFNAYISSVGTTPDPDKPANIPNRELEDLPPEYGEISSILKRASDAYTSGDKGTGETQLGGLAIAMLEARDFDKEQVIADVDALVRSSGVPASVASILLEEIRKYKKEPNTLGKALRFMFRTQYEGDTGTGLLPTFE